MMYCLELKNYTTRANLIPCCIKELKTENRNSGKAVAKAIKIGNISKAIRCALKAKERKMLMCSLTQEHDKLVYDKNGNCVGYRGFSDSHYTFD